MKNRTVISPLGVVHAQGAVASPAGGRCVLTLRTDAQEMKKARYISSRQTSGLSIESRDPIERSGTVGGSKWRPFDFTKFQDGRGSLSGSRERRPLMKDAKRRKFDALLVFPDP
jgi:hypothetical protein